MSADVLVIGLGFAGATTARALADRGFRVRAVDRRDHIGGNAYDALDAHGVLVHRYGPHLFHTNSAAVVAFLSRFTEWRPYEYRVLSEVDGRLVPFPVNRTTLNLLYELDLDEAGAAAFLARVRKPRSPVRTSEDAVLSSVGPDLCEKLFRGYSRKQWGLDLRDLAASVAARIPVRTDDDDRYFSDRYQQIPAHGYTAMFERMLAHPLIDLETGREWAAGRPATAVRHIVFTGPIDAWYGYRFGPLPYRSMHFEHTHLPDIEFAQPLATIHYPQEHAFTRSTEFKHITGQRHAGTSILREFPQADGDPFYPIPRPENAAIYRRYAALAGAETSVTFLGRLAQYRYLNMDQVVAAALQVSDAIARRLGARGPAGAHPDQTRPLSRA